MAADEAEIATQGRNSDCGVAQVVARDPAQVRRVIGPSAYEPTYLAYQLDTALWMRKNRALYVRIRKPQPSRSPMRQWSARRSDPATRRSP